MAVPTCITAAAVVLATTRQGQSGYTSDSGTIVES